jgi:hypothetical protein
MKKVFKYEMPITEEFEIEMPQWAVVLSFQVQNGKPCIWVFVDEDTPLTKFKFCLYGTGEIINLGHLVSHVGTIQLDGFVWHLFIDQRLGFGADQTTMLKKAG